MYLPDDIPGAQVLITVKTYPLPSNKYNELVCTAGLLPSGKWIRLYPVPFRALPYADQYSKYHFMIIGVFYPPKPKPSSKGSTQGNAQQLPLFGE
jgi:hypothetical protein